MISSPNIYIEPVDDSAPPARPLVVRCGAFGDMVILTALFRVLHAEFGCPIDLLTSGPWSKPLLAGQPGVGRIYTVRSRKTPFWLSIDQHRAVHELRARGVGPTWFCDGNDAAMPLLQRAGIPGAWIVAARNHDLEPGEHATQQWRRLAQIMPAAVYRPPSKVDLAAIAPGCFLEVSDAQRRDLARWLTSRGIGSVPLIAIQIGNKRTMRRGLRRLAVNSKYWPKHRWAEVLRHLRQAHPQHAIVLVGTGPEFELNRELGALAQVSMLVNGADDLPIPRLIALLERADGLISVDSGPAHAAAAVGCPQVVLFGKALPSLYRPWGVAGANVALLTGNIDGTPDMMGIEADSVCAAWDSLRLRSRAPRASD